MVRPVHCMMHRGNTPIAMIYHWAMQPWCQCCKAALGILAYIDGTSGVGITYQRGTSVSISLEVFADADYASKTTDRRFVSGGATMCGGACLC